MHRFVLRFALRLVALVATLAFTSSSVMAQAPKGANVLVLDPAVVGTDVALADIPPRHRGRLEVAFGSVLVLGSAFLGMLGAYMQGPPLFCGLFSDDPNPPECAPQHDGGLAFAGSALAGVGGITLLVVGGRTIHRRNAALRALEEHQAYVRPIVIRDQGNAGLVLTLGARF